MFHTQGVAGSIPASRSLFRLQTPPQVSASKAGLKLFFTQPCSYFRPRGLVVFQGQWQSMRCSSDAAPSVLHNSLPQITGRTNVQLAIATPQDVRIEHAQSLPDFNLRPQRFA
jgi:hypothetical protein